MMRGLILGSVVAASLLATSAASAAVGVGDRPKVRLQTVEGRWFQLAELKGRIIVLDFWATWCGPCMAEMPHMTRINEQLGPKGVQIIGVSLDKDKQAVLSTVRDKGMNWPQVYDGLGWNSPVVAQFGVRGIPRVFILSPEGQVLWTGHPSQMDDPLERALRSHPPSIAAKKQSADDAIGLIGKAHDAAAQNQDYAAAIGALSDLELKLLAQPAVLEKAQSLLALLSDSAHASAVSQLLTDEASESAAQFRNFKDAVAAAQAKAAASVTDAAAGKASAADGAASAGGADADDADHAMPPEVIERLAGARLRSADRLREREQNHDAFDSYLRIVERWPESEAGIAAAEHLAAYRADEAFMQAHLQHENDKRAKAMLAMAQGYLAAHQRDHARDLYKQVTEQFPDTAHAREARAALAKLR